jgi:hypothetical protein
LAQQGKLAVAFAQAYRQIVSMQSWEKSEKNEDVSLYKSLSALYQHDA